MELATSSSQSTGLQFGLYGVFHYINILYYKSNYVYSDNEYSYSTNETFRRKIQNCFLVYFHVVFSTVHLVYIEYKYFSLELTKLQCIYDLPSDKL